VSESSECPDEPKTKKERSGSRSGKEKWDRVPLHWGLEIRSFCRYGRVEEVRDQEYQFGSWPSTPFTKGKQDSAFFFVVFLNFLLISFLP
jgi:hypothetical protein